MDNNMRNQKLSEIQSSWRQILALLARILGIVADLRNESDLGYIYTELMQKLAEAMRLIVEEMCKKSGEPNTRLDASLDDMQSLVTEPFAHEAIAEKVSPIFVDHSQETCRECEQDKHLFME